jgi:hypothetical protein
MGLGEGASEKARVDGRGAVERRGWCGCREVEEMCSWTRRGGRLGRRLRDGDFCVVKDVLDIGFGS